MDWRQVCETNLFRLDWVFHLLGCRHNGYGDGTATATAAMAAPLFTAEINNSLVINYNCNLDRRPAFNYHLLCQFETAASSSSNARWMRVLVKVSVTLTVFS